MSFDPTKKVTTRDGRRARILCTDRRSVGNSFPIIALVETKPNTEICYSYTEYGYSSEDRLECDEDLINPKTKVVKWGWVEKGSTYPFINLHDTEERALEALARAVSPGRHYSGTNLVKVEYETDDGIWDD